MNTERFIARRVGGSTNTFSNMIIRIAIAAVALSIMVMIITTNVITGFKNEISEKVFSFWGHIHVTDYSADDSFALLPIQKDEALIQDISNIKRVDFQPPSSLLRDDPDRIVTEGGVVQVDPYIVVPSIVADKKNFEALLLKGVDRQYDVTRMEQALQSGSFISFSDTMPSRDLLISKYTADRMNFSVGQKVNVHFMFDNESLKRRFQIAGIYKTGLGEYDRSYGIVDLRILQELLGWRGDQVTGLEIFVEDLEDMEGVNDYIYYELLPPATTSETVKSKFFQLFKWLEMQNINERIITTLMLLVALINMVTAILIFVLERSHMIGVLKSLGGTDWLIRKIFMYSAGRVILFGVLIGNAAALLFSYFQKKTHLLKLDEENYYLDHVPIEFNWPSILMLNVGAIAIILLFMLVPTLIVTKIKPVKVLRFD